MAKQEEHDLLKHKIQSFQDAAAYTDTAHQEQMQAMQKQVAELKDIIDCSMHTKRASTLKLETAMNALNLSKPDAKRFVEVLPNQCCCMDMFSMLGNSFPCSCGSSRCPCLTPCEV